LNPLDIFLLQRLKTLEFAIHIDNKVKLHKQIEDAFPNIRNHPSIFESMWWSMMRSVKEWSESCGGHSEHFL
jgi:hypothetical protein